jgi:hypothetical protein
VGAEESPDKGEDGGRLPVIEKIRELKGATALASIPFKNHRGLLHWNVFENPDSLLEEYIPPLRRLNKARAFY